MLAIKTQTTEGRAIAYRTRGHRRGPITRLVSPSDLGEVMKPFVFLDHVVFDAQSEPTPMAYLWHPHSGIATVTVPLDGAVRIADTTGADVVLPAGGIEWMRAGNGVWHTGTAQPGGMLGFQLWVALPPALENAASASSYIQPAEVPTVGPARVILGAYGGARSPIDAPPGMTYLQVDLRAGERWTYEPPRGHTVAWLAVGQGRLCSAEIVDAGEVAVFEAGSGALEVIAEVDTRFVFGSAEPHPHELVLGNYSVHTSRAALDRGEAEIRAIGRKLRDDGTLKYARPAVDLSR